MLDRFQRPLFRRGEGRVDEGFTQIDLAAVPKVLGEALQQPIKAARALPELEATMAGLVRRIARGQVVPRRTRAQDPQDAVHDGARIGPRPAAPVRATTRAEGRFEHGPLGVGEVHAVEYDGESTDVSGRDRIYEIASRTISELLFRSWVSEGPALDHPLQQTRRRRYRQFVGILASGAVLGDRLPEDENTPRPVAFST